MKDQITQAFLPFGKIARSTLTTSLVVELLVFFILWNFGTMTFLPKPMDIVHAYPSLMSRGLIAELWVSMKLCLKCILYATVLSAIISYLSKIPVFTYISQFVTKGRFLSSVGLSFFFTLLSSDGNGLKTGLLVFFVTVVLTTNFISSINNIEEFRYNHARTLGLNQWQTLWYVVIKGKFSDLLEFMKQNFAITWMLLTMVEGIVRSEGGIGVMLLNENRVLRLDNIFAIQILIFCVGIFLDWAITEIKNFLCPYSNLSNLKK